MSKHLAGVAGAGTARLPGAQVARAAARLLLGPALLLNVVAPVVAFQVLAGQGTGTAAALILVSGFPLVGIALGAVRHRRLDPIALLSLVAIVVGVVAGLVRHNGWILLVKDSIVTGVLGVVFLVSLLAPHPMTFTLRRRLLVTDNQGALESYDRTWTDPLVRARSRRMTAVWGVALVGEAATRVALSLVVSPGRILAISPVLAVVAFAPLALWTFRHRSDPRSADTVGLSVDTAAGAGRGPGRG